MLYPYAVREECKLKAGEVFRSKGLHLKNCKNCSGVWADGGWCQHMMKLDYQQLALWEIYQADKIRHPAECPPPFGTVGKK